MRVRTLIALAGLTAAALAGCGDDEATIIAKEGPKANDVVLSVAHSGGFIAPSATFSETPSAVVYGDGTTLQPGAMIEIYPGPAYVPLHEGKLTQDVIDGLLEQAQEQELDLTGEPVDAGQPPVADAPDTVLVIRTPDGKVVTHSANALGMDVGGAETMTEQQQDARRRMQEMVSAIESAVSDVASDEFVPDGYRLRATGADPAQFGGTADGEPEPRIKPWPVAGVDLAAAAECLAVTGADADGVRDTMKQADQLTFFTSAGTTYQVVIRPLLPDEDGCPTS